MVKDTENQQAIKWVFHGGTRQFVCKHVLSFLPDRCSKIKNPEVDWVSVEVREKGLHLFGSDWVGELQFYAHQFKDGKVHQDWFALTKLPFKKHSREARGYIHLAFQLLNSKSDFSVNFLN